MMTTSADIRAIRRQAFQEAAEALMRTAADFAEMATRINPHPSHRAQLDYRAKIEEKKSLNEKADLLRGQAGYIREMT